MSHERPRLFPHDDHAVAIVTGRHRARFLHAMTTASLTDRAPGDAGFALMATSNGRHIGQVRFEVTADRIELVGRQASLAAVLEGLRKHRVADDVRWTDPAGVGLLALYGPSAAAIASAVLGPLPEGATGELTWDGQPVRVTRIPALESELGREALHLRLASALAPSLRVRLLAAGAEPMDKDVWERARIEAGWPLDGDDLGTEDVALASERLAATVSWTKGCFLGQEVYVMARDRGELPKRLRRVVTTAGAAPRGRAELVDANGKVQGVLGSAAMLPSGGWLGLAMLKRKASEPGTELVVGEGGSRVSVTT
ncbi:MAG: aminomethyltransferase family protein [Deltaproteobacteria bacterium]|jgi:folate-binding protein YgfZ|nr:aminomethyltransferase family protein [Deltaproteobacteria bacterium]